MTTNFLPAPNQASQQDRAEGDPVKASESEALELNCTDPQQTGSEPQRTSSQFHMGSIGWPNNKEKNYFETDANEVEEMFDSTGADGLSDRPTSSVVNSDLFSAPCGECEVTEKATNDIYITPQAEEPRLPEQISANGRAVIRKHFSKAPPIILPKGHATVSFSEPQIHAVLKTWMKL